MKGRYLLKPTVPVHSLWMIEVHPRNPTSVTHQFVNPQRIMTVCEQDGVWVITLDDDSQWTTTLEWLNQ